MFGLRCVCEKVFVTLTCTVHRRIAMHPWCNAVVHVAPMYVY